MLYVIESRNEDGQWVPLDIIQDDSIVAAIRRHCNLKGVIDVQIMPDDRMIFNVIVATVKGSSPACRSVRLAHDKDKAAVVARKLGIK